jgi:hypothetical protein
VQTANGVFLLFFYGANSNLSGTPYATCSLIQTELLQGPGGPSGLAASSGDGAVTLTWGNPSTTLPQPQYYQVLCADADDQPIKSNPQQNIYSTCTPQGLERRQLPTGGTVITTGDGGTGTASEPFGTASAGFPGPEPDATADGGTSDGGTNSGPMPTNLGAPFTFLDRAFVCSDGIPIGSSGNTVRVAGLANNKLYKFAVVAVDQYGNPTPNDNGIVTATPQPVEDLYRRYRDSGGGGSGFCLVAPGASSSYDWVWLLVGGLVATLLLLRRRMRRT